MISAQEIERAAKASEDFKKRFSELAGEAACNQEYAGALQE
jgi:hypothetical protein